MPPAVCSAGAISRSSTSAFPASCRRIRLEHGEQFGKLVVTMT
jgi:hypothetical protein